MRLRRETPEASVAESTVCQYVRARKAAMGLLGHETFVPQSYEWGGEAQVDWYEGWAEYGGDWSIAKFIEATETEDERERAEVMDLILTYNKGDLGRFELAEAGTSRLSQIARATKRYGRLFKPRRFRAIITRMPQPLDSITQALDDWMDRIQDANPDVRLELLTEEQLEGLYATVKKLCPDG